MTRSTDAAQRRLLEALAEQNKTAGGIAGLRIAFPFAVELAEASGEPALAGVWRALDDLAASVQSDLAKESSGG